MRDGEWKLLECKPAWDGNWTHDCFSCVCVAGAHRERLVVAVNYAANQSQCHVRIPFADLAGKTWRLDDQLCTAHYEWNGNDLCGRGLFLDLAPWQASIFSLTETANGTRQ